jgi:hypothetical protein
MRPGFVVTALRHPISRIGVAVTSASALPFLFLLAIHAAPLNQMGHTTSMGCFRGHDESHKPTEGLAIRQDCELCHTIE